MKYYANYNGKLNKRIERYKNGKKKIFCTDIVCLDIETTSAWIDSDGNVIPYEFGHDSDYWNGLQPISLPYIWMLSINDTVYYGREFTDILKMFDMFPDYHVIIWIHNLSFEFQFLCNLFSWKQVFAKTPHKVIKCIPREYPNIEFRCTYFLTRLSLANWGVQIGLPKLTGDLDYYKMRTPLTTLTDKEKEYCKRDVLVMFLGLSIYRNEYETLENIPLTQTGTVRRKVRELLTKDYRYMYHIKKLVPRDASEYAMLQRLFSGGYTHANRLYSGKVIKGEICHYDFASSYPYVMLSCKYPMSPWIMTKIDAYNMPEDTDEFAYIYHIVFTGIVCKTWNTYIQSSKCINMKEPLFDNGRVIEAEYLEIWVTEQDYETINESYDWEYVEVMHAYKSRKGYLPRKFLEYLLELYHNKTALKDVAEYEALYLQSKQYINSMFGMMVTAILQSDVLFDGIYWTIDKLSENDINKRLYELRNTDSKENRYFLSYSWGVYVTAYARRNLWKCILQYDDRVLYADTDSIFMLGKGDFSKYNSSVYTKNKMSCDINNLDFEKTRPTDKRGKKHPIGIFVEEPMCSEFITLGAKRYCTREDSDNQLHITISGINKQAVELLDNDISNFKDGFVFDKDASCVKKMLLTYLSEQPIARYPDGYISTYQYGINMRNNGYKLSITDEYKLLINYVDRGLYDSTDGELNARRGRTCPHRKRGI